MRVIACNRVYYRLLNASGALRVEFLLLRFDDSLTSSTITVPFCRRPDLMCVPFSFSSAGGCPPTYTACDGTPGAFTFKCIHPNQMCDTVPHCVDQKDERDCYNWDDPRAPPPSLNQTQL